MTLETRDDRTLFFDMLPLAVRAQGGGLTLKLKIFTVPGQVLHTSTRRLVLQGTDGVAFVADSRSSQIEENARSFVDLRDNLKGLGRSPRDVPLVIQFNKRDLEGVRSEVELEALAKKGGDPVFFATALTGVGVRESFFGLLHLTLLRLDSEHDLSNKVGLDLNEFIALAALKLGYLGDVRAVSGGLVPSRAEGAR